MPTKTAALQAWLEGFGLPVYRDSSVPTSARMPYITYSLSLGMFGEGECYASVDVWYRTASEAVPTAKAEEIGRDLGLGGRVLACEGGAMWVKRGEPFCQAMADEDDAVKRRTINLSIEYMTDL